jgi:hypothetical protein
MKYAESWIGDSGEVGFPIIKIDTRLAEAAHEGESWIVRGDFHRVGGPDGSVTWDPSDDGKFELSLSLKKEFQNRRKRVRVYNGTSQRVEYHWGPVDSRFVIGCDAFGFDNKQLMDKDGVKSRKSDGGIAAFYPYDGNVDKEDEPENMQSDRFVLSYRHRPPSSDAYNEDVLMACIYFGAWCYPERNATATWEYFLRRGYGGYLKYDRDPSSGKPNDKPGYWMGKDGKSNMFVEIHDYLQKNCHREKHASFLMECKQIRGPEELKNYDRLAAHGAALMGARDMNITLASDGGINKIEEAYKALGHVF